MHFEDLISLISDISSDKKLSIQDRYKKLSSVINFTHDEIKSELLSFDTKVLALIGCLHYLFGSCKPRYPTIKISQDIFINQTLWTESLARRPALHHLKQELDQESDQALRKSCSLAIKAISKSSSSSLFTAKSSCDFKKLRDKWIGLRSSIISGEEPEIMAKWMPAIGIHLNAVIAEHQALLPLPTELATPNASPDAPRTEFATPLPSVEYQHEENSVSFPEDFEWHDNNDAPVSSEGDIFEYDSLDASTPRRNIRSQKNNSIRMRTKTVSKKQSTLTLETVRKEIRKEIKHAIETDIKDEIQKQIREELKPVYERLDKVEDRLDKVEERLDKIEDRLDKIEVRLDNLEKRFDNLEKRFDKFEERFDKLEERFDKFEKKFDKLEGVLTVLVKVLVKDNDLSAQIKSALDSLE